MENTSKSLRIPLIIGGLVLIITVGAGGLILTLSSKNNNTVSTSNSTLGGNGLESIPSNITNSSQYKDGTYTSTGNYDSPGGMEKIGVTVTLTNGVIKSVSVDTGTPSSFDAQKYQNKFSQGISGVVVGKSLDQATVGRVNGSSLTGIGFNEAITKIKTQAKV